MRVIVITCCIRSQPAQFYHWVDMPADVSTYDMTSLSIIRSAINRYTT